MRNHAQPYPRHHRIIRYHSRRGEKFFAPTNAPTIAPTNAPTIAPTNAPTIAPTNNPIIPVQNNWFHCSGF
ncbi:MAG: hypothetical protein GX109_00105 [Bacteroidales bacterium]|nr:hypothetical protein [Bacteroidales bacterium]